MHYLFTSKFAKPAGGNARHILGNVRAIDSSIQVGPSWWKSGLASPGRTLLWFMAAITMGSPWSEYHKHFPLLQLLPEPCQRATGSGNIEQYDCAR